MSTDARSDVSVVAPAAHTGARSQDSLPSAEGFLASSPRPETKRAPGAGDSGSSSPESGPQAAPAAEGQDAPVAEAQTVLTLAEAARTVGLSERALRKHIQRGRLVSSTIVRNGRTIAAVDLETLKRTYGELQMVPTATVRLEGESGPRATRLRSKVELDQRKRLKEQMRARHELEGRLGKLKALLGMERAQKKEMQRQMQFLADSLARAEARLEQVNETSRGLALDLGVARGRAEELERQIATAATEVESAPAPMPVRPVSLDSDPLPMPTRGGVRN